MLRSAVVLLSLAIAAPASAQMRGTVAIGGGVSSVRPADDALTTRARLRPFIRRLPSRGWGFAFALNWFDADVNGSFAGADETIGRVSIRPLMFGIGYTAVAGRVSFAPSVVAGPALNTLDINATWEPELSIGGGRFEENVGTISLAVRPGANVTYALAPHVGLTAFGGYLFNRPAFTVRTPGGDLRTRWTTDGLVANAGVIVSF